MIKSRYILALCGLALASGCTSPKDTLEQAITDQYQGDGGEDVAVTLTAGDDGGFTGPLDYTTAAGDRVHVQCIVQPANDDGEATWRCAPSIQEIEHTIVADYTSHGATDVTASLHEDGDNYAGFAEFTDPGNQQQYRVDCSVDLSAGNGNWTCEAPSEPGADAAAAAGPAPTKG